jgi:hypothetical protein
MPDTAVLCDTRPRPSEAFAERARLLVAFVLERGREIGIGTLRLEHEVMEWIFRWRQVAPAAQYFFAVELGIILRALNGPAAGGVRADGADNEQLCWLIARCMSQTA